MCTVCVGLPLRFIAGTSLQWDLQNSTAQTHKQGPVALQDLQVKDWFLLICWKELHLLEITSVQILAGCGQRLDNGAMFCLIKPETIWL